MLNAQIDAHYYASYDDEHEQEAQSSNYIVYYLWVYCLFDHLLSQAVVVGEEGGQRKVVSVKGHTGWKNLYREERHYLGANLSEMSQASLSKASFSR